MARRRPRPVRGVAKMMVGGFSKNGRCGPRHGGTRCHGAACCSPHGWCGGRKGHRSAWCVRGKGGAWGGRFDGPAPPVRGAVKKFGRPAWGVKKIGGHPCNRVPHPHQRRKCFRKAKMKARRARAGRARHIQFKQAKKVGKTNRGMKSLGKLNFKVGADGVHPLNRHLPYCQTNPPGRGCDRHIKMARRI